MCAAASLVEERFGGERSEYVKSSCHTPHCLAYEADVIGSFQHISMAYREFLLRGAKLRVEQFYGDALNLQCFQDRVYDFRFVVQSNTAVTQAMIGRYIFAVLCTREIEFVLYSCFRTHPLLVQARNHSFEEGSWTCLPGFAIRENHVTHHAAAAWHVGQSDKGIWIWYKAEFADRPHTLNRSK